MKGETPSDIELERKLVEEQEPDIWSTANETDRRLAEEGDL